MSASGPDGDAAGGGFDDDLDGGEPFFFVQRGCFAG